MPNNAMNMDSQKRRATFGCRLWRTLGHMSDVTSTSDSERPSHASRLAFWLCLAGVVFLSIFVAFLFLRHAYQNPAWLMNVFEQHFAATVGLPLAMIAALVVVTLFRHQAGPIEFDLLGMRLRGAAGPIVMWVIVFLSMASGIKLLW